MAKLIKALGSIDRLLETLKDGQQNEKTYTGLGIVYKAHTANFRCNYSNMERAKQSGRNYTIDKCYRAGNSNCRVLSNRIIKNGYLGYINGNYYGYGCTASVIVRGSTR